MSRGRRRPSCLATRTLAIGLALVASSACASIPRGRYGVADVDFRGTERLDSFALRACLGTKERPRFTLNLGHTTQPECGVGPFDSSRLRLPLFAWPWTDWPLYDEAVFERDLARIERWYRARGYYDANVVATGLTPAAALESDRPDGPSVCGAERDEGCELEIAIEVEEGEPVLVTELEVEGIDGLPVEVRELVEGAMQLELGKRFDEAAYDQTKRTMERALGEGSYARAHVEGEVVVDPDLRTAKVHFHVETGPRCHIGDIRVTGEDDLPVTPIYGAAQLKVGDPFSLSALEEAQRAIWELGAFASVSVEPKLSEANRDPASIPIIIRVAPGRLFRFGLGAGVQSGTFEVTAGNEIVDVPQWDGHLLGVVEHRNFLGGLRRIRIEERPRLIFQDSFPRPTDPTPGNLATVTFRQPAFLEARTALAASARWDLGPDPFGTRYFRHDLDARVGPERTFFSGRLYVSVGVHGNLFVVTSAENATERPPSDHHVTFLEQYVRLDLRDDPRQPTKGAYFGIGLHEAGVFLPSSWDYLRVTPDARGYVPLPFGFVLAGRFAVGATFITGRERQCTYDELEPGVVERVPPSGDATNEPCLDPTSYALGPQRYRLRGGGASSVRGFAPATLGDGIDGGLRRWEASVELRARLTEDFGAVLFVDMGDVHAGKTFRFDQLHTSIGGGLRYRTPVGPLRFDLGVRVPSLQSIGPLENDPGYELDLGFVRFGGAVHLTIGEAF